VYYFSDASIKGRKDAGFGEAIIWDTPLLEGYPSFFIRNFGRSLTTRRMAIENGP